MIRRKRTEEKQQQPCGFIVDRLPSSFINDPQTFAMLLAEQIDRFWPASGFNFLYNEAGQVNGFFDGKFLFLIELSSSYETFSIATCLHESEDANEETQDRIKIALDIAKEDVKLENYFTRWTGDQELILCQEKLAVDLVREIQVEGFEEAMESFIEVAHKLGKALRKTEKRDKKRGRFFGKGRGRGKPIVQDSTRTALVDDSELEGAAARDTSTSHSHRGGLVNMFRQRSRKIVQRSAPTA